MWIGWNVARLDSIKLLIQIIASSTYSYKSLNTGGHISTHMYIHTLTVLGEHAHPCYGTLLHCLTISVYIGCRLCLQPNDAVYVS